MTHGASVNLSGKLYRAFSYGLERDTETLDYAEMEALAREHKPKLIIAGASAYSRSIDFQRFRSICDEVGAYLMVDIAHYAGLIAAGLYPSPVGIADFVTSTTHKTLRGPRGGLILAKAQYAALLDKTIFPVYQGGPLMHVIAAKAVAFNEALSDGFRHYQQRVIDNARTMADILTRRGLRVVSGGTDCHMFLLDLRSMNITGKDAEALLESAHITLNKNSIPDDPQKPAITSGIRIGTPALTTRGFGEAESAEVANLIADLLEQPSNAILLENTRRRVMHLCECFPVYLMR